MPPTPDMIPIWRQGDNIWIVDQRRLPGSWHEVRIATVETMAEAIRTLAVRGAPAIGIAGGYGYWIAARLLLAEHPQLSAAALQAELTAAATMLRETRPTAVNLGWALDRMERVAQALLATGEVPANFTALLGVAAQAIADEDLTMCRRIGAAGAALIQSSEGILTHCNAGGLATGGYGTALGVLRAAHAAGKAIHVYVDETRPLGQGARLTTYELHHAGIPYTLITDSMAGSLMTSGRIQRVITGADRIAANGDAVNKIGTYSVAVLARHHGIPFHIAAPSSTVDLSLMTGAAIPIEERATTEVTAPYGAAEYFADVPVWNPAFDCTPAALIASIITEQGVLEGPYAGRLAAHLGAA